MCPVFSMLLLRAVFIVVYTLIVLKFSISNDMKYEPQHFKIIHINLYVSKFNRLNWTMSSVLVPTPIPNNDHSNKNNKHHFLQRSIIENVAKNQFYKLIISKRKSNSILDSFIPLRYSIDTILFFVFIFTIFTHSIHASFCNCKFGSIFKF